MVRSQTGRLYWRNRKFIWPYRYIPSKDKDNDPKWAGSETGKENNRQRASQEQEGSSWTRSVQDRRLDPSEVEAFPWGHGGWSTLDEKHQKMT